MVTTHPVDQAARLVGVREVARVVRGGEPADDDVPPLLAKSPDECCCDAGDWTGSRPGPALYDVASAVMYAGGIDRSSQFLAAYSEQSGFPVTSIKPHLTAFLRLRGAVQAVYFGDRITAAGLTGADPSDDDEKGPEDARHLLGALGV